ncbi:hypothetical protein FBU30_003737 [Linnemannia zychae]|nr:hypothetical protein FBU30_003737 [Linnemannia zychae]
MLFESYSIGVNPMVIDYMTKYTKWSIPVSPKVHKYRDVVLGLQVKDLKISHIEAIIISFDQIVNEKFLFTCEVITPVELQQMCAPLSTLKSIGSDNTILKWKLKERFIGSDWPSNVTIEVKTWEGAPPDYGAINIQWVESHTNVLKYYQNAVDKTGHPEIDDICPGTKLVESYVYSKQGSHLLLSVRTMSALIVQLWQIRPLSASDSRSVPQFGTLSLEEIDEDKMFCPKVVAWVYFDSVPKHKSIDLILSHEGTLLAIVDENVVHDSDNGSDNESGNTAEDKKDSMSWTTFYKFRPDILGTGKIPEGASGGSGLEKIDIPETCPGLSNFYGRAEFHITATKDPDVKDELLVACDGVTIDVYSVFGEWNHIRSIVIDSMKTALKFRRNVFAALFKQLRGNIMLLVNAEGTEVTTWNIETGKAVSSSTNFDPSEFWSLRHIANVTRDGRLVAVPGQRKIVIYETATWDVVGWYQFPRVGDRDYVSEGLFVNNDKEIMVSVDSDERLFYQGNRGYVISLENMAIKELYASVGHGRFELLPKMHPEEEPLFLAVDTTGASVFRMEGRLLMAPQKLNDLDSSQL